MLIFLILLLPLALAGTTLNTDKTAYTSGETVTVSGICTSSSGAPKSVPVGLKILLEGETVLFDQVKADASGKYTSQFIPPQKGKYTIIAACDGETGQSLEITVSDAVSPLGGTPAPSTPSTGGNGGGGGGGGCIPKWQYSEWSKCNATLQQSRTAIELTGKCPNKKPDPQNLLQSCPSCQESWTCTGWSECSEGLQTRECSDDSLCGTNLLMPETTRDCEVPEEEFPEQPPTPPSKPAGKPTLPQVTAKVSSFWENYQFWIIGIPLLLLLIVLLIVLLRVLFKKKLIYDEKEVKQWARKEQAAGTSPEDVKEIIKQYTHWPKEKIEQVVSGLR